MRKVHDVLRLQFGLKMPQRQIARSIQVSQSTVSEYSTRSEQSGLSWPLPEGIDDQRLQQKLFGSAAGKPERFHGNDHRFQLKAINDFIFGDHPSERSDAGFLILR